LVRRCGSGAAAVGRLAWQGRRARRNRGARSDPTATSGSRGRACFACARESTREPTQKHPRSPVVRVRVRGGVRVLHLFAALARPGILRGGSACTTGRGGSSPRRPFAGSEPITELQAGIAPSRDLIITAHYLAQASFAEREREREKGPQILRCCSPPGFCLHAPRARRPQLFVFPASPLGHAPCRYLRRKARHVKAVDDVVQKIIWQPSALLLQRYRKHTLPRAKFIPSFVSGHGLCKIWSLPCVHDYDAMITSSST